MQELQELVEGINTKLVPPKEIDATKGLDARYKEALVCHHMFRQLCQEKALMFDGFFAVEEHAPRSHQMSQETLDLEQQTLDRATATKKFVKWKDVQGTEEADRIKWTTVKSVDRAIEKLYRTYNFDASRLLDLVRETISFESIAQLRACLANLAEDPCVRIIRIKSQLRREFNARVSSGGYRTIIVNLCLVTPFATAMGVQEHAAELQMTLLPFMRLRTREAHGRYKLFRDLRGQ